MAETKPWHRQSFQSCERIDSPRPEWLLESNIWNPQYTGHKSLFYHQHHHSEEDNACIDGRLTIVCSLCHVGPPGSFWPDVGVVDGRRQDLRPRFCWILSTFWISFKFFSRQDQDCLKTLFLKIFLKISFVVIDGRQQNWRPRLS